LVVSELKLTIKNWGTVALEKRELSRVMRGAGNDVRSKTARLINQSTGDGRKYRGGGGSQYRGSYVAGPYTASAPGEAPVRVSGKLREMLKTYVFKSGEGFAVRARQFYALFLEVGARGGGNRFGGKPQAAKLWRERRHRQRGRGLHTTRVLEPRPFLDRVMQEQQGEIDRRVRKALTQGLTWKESKAQ